MEFNKAYKREEYLSFLRVNFLPDDFQQKISSVENPVQFQYTQQVTRLGECESLGLVVYEVRHNSKHDARVGLTKEAFRLLADEFCERALVFFVPKDDDSNYRFSLIEITLDQSKDSSRISRRYSNPHRYSYYLGKGIAYYTPNKYLNEYGRVISVEDLRNRFSVEVLTKAFYQELSDWYAWAIMKVHFPNDLNTLEDNQKYNSEAMIRLITRLIFVWFLKQRHLVPNEFFDEQFISSHLLKNFIPNAKVTLFGKADNSYYYKGILQNLFFAMLNSPITPEGKDTISERRFSKGRSDYDNNKLMRHQELFIDPNLFVELANKYVPFLNGGLFDCLDDKDNGKYIDAFTDREAIAKQLIVPDYLFFGEEAGKNIDLSEYYGDKKKKKVSARGIIDILKRYNFTVEENTPFDQEVSLDPELLGKVFENLLAAYNPETQTTARKQTGSFYTPREIVQYMVDESLVAHLKRTVGEDLEPEYRKLIQYTDEELQLTDDQKRQIMQSLYECKVLDPACGSGAFPMGMLQQMVHILGQLDPNNEQWKDMMLNNAIEEAYNAEHGVSEEEEKEIKAEIFRSFDENLNRPDYARKLYLIENCIYGVDIQPIAIQISKLRFFISLVVDQKTNNNPVDNFGIRPLPNLEAKFVAANTLIGLEEKDANLFTSKAVVQKEAEMKEAKHRIFGAKTVKTKRKYKERVTELRDELAKMLEDIGAVGNEEAKLLATWDMFDQNASSPFFDSEWMFNINNGFDIVIGNPPYGVINKKQNKGESVTVPTNVFKKYKELKKYKPAQGGMLNIFRLFVVQSFYLLKHGGVFSEIFPLAFACDVSAYKLREFIQKECSIISLEAFPERDNPKKRVFENAKISVCILTMLAQANKKCEFDIRINTDRFVDFNIETGQLSYNDINRMDSRYLTIPLSSPKDLNIIRNVFIKSRKFSEFGKCNTGEIDMTFCKDAFTKDPNDIKMIRGANLDRYIVKETMSQGETFFLNRIKLSSIKEIGDSLFTELRIVMQGITGVNEKVRLKMTISQNAYCANSVNYCSFKKDTNLYLYLGLFNSKLLNYIFKQFSSNSNVNGYEVDNLPIVLPIPERIGTIAKSVVAAKAFDEKADTKQKELEIDLLVYHLYGLTYDEVLIVDPETPITREKYENC